VARNETASPFDLPGDKRKAVNPDAPLAEWMRPRSLDELVGQAGVVGEDSELVNALTQGGKLPSLVLWGPPGSGKATLERLIAERSGARFIAHDRQRDDHDIGFR
jgi:putative ATPase